jgi:hypothetical protein
MGKYETHTKFRSENQKERRQCENLGLAGKIVLN